MKDGDKVVVTEASVSMRGMAGIRCMPGKLLWRVQGFYEQFLKLKRELEEMGMFARSIDRLPAMQKGSEW